MGGSGKEGSRQEPQEEEGQTVPGKGRGAHHAARPLPRQMFTSRVQKLLVCRN